ncbi:porin family protein [Glaciecola sp. MH2013]|uniref:outer membrane beta-barrel protein n=1 Tax=Glaciecola sp. MH2013 TaxID=2785524 RepID=UPI00189FEC7C|nr:outer membrane beta-barrel protein [Glaciecola sp. MH2013]MBF7073394.1 porin family protein [Glaciecola sp. MH2013]
MNRLIRSFMSVSASLAFCSSMMFAGQVGATQSFQGDEELSPENAPNAIYFEDYQYEYNKSRCLESKRKGDCAFEYFYFTMSAGLNTGSKSAINVEQAARDIGFEAFDIEQDDSGTPFKLAIGASITDELSLELGYTKLNEADLAFSTTTNDPERFFDVARQVRPNKVKGWTLAAVYSFYTSESWYAYARLGGYNWEGDYRSFDVFGDRELEAEDSSDGVDIFYGIGASYKFSQRFELNLEYERYNVEDNKDYILWLGLSYHFED